MINSSSICTLICCVFAIAVFSTGCAIHVIRHFELTQSNEATVFTVVRTVRAMSRLHCASLCSTSSDCLAFRFSPEASECHLSNEEPGGFGSAVGVFSYGLRKRSGLLQCKRLATTADGRLSCPIQQRVGDNISFQQPWTAYEAGFGDDVNFWLGLQPIHQLTTPLNSTLVVDMVTWPWVWYHQEYPNFLVQDGSTNYTMTVGLVLVNMSTLPDERMAPSNGMQFSTTDRDNDIGPTMSCSNLYHGSSGWWFSVCSHVSPNGLYCPTEQGVARCLGWKINNIWVSMRSMRLMVLV